jgi:alpha-glucosidase (family GH31 glycosyl hydrolase)
MGGKTLSMNSYHAGDILEYNAHSLYGLMEAIATKQALENTRQSRAFQVSRSTFLSSGAYTAHWTGDNNASWADLAASIITMNNLALFGIPVTGADM